MFGLFSFTEISIILNAAVGLNFSARLGLFGGQELLDRVSSNWLYVEYGNLKD